MIAILISLIIVLTAALLILVVLLLRRDSGRRAEEFQHESTVQFKAIASDLLRAQAQELREANSRQMDAILRPLSQNLTDFRRTINDCYVQENASRKSLADQVDRLMRLNESIGNEARNLTFALKGNSKVQGDWGEMVLTTLLEQAGLQEGIHFLTQATRDDEGHTFRDSEGRLQRPDVIVNLPEGRKIIIDSKTSLTAYADLCAAQDDVTRTARTRDHVRSIRSHIDELATKRYDRTVSGSADYVMMFVPNEGAYIAAQQAEPELWQYAFQKGVAIVSPTHLFSVMQIISQLWVQDKQNRHTLEIARKGGALYDKVMLFMQSFEDVGNALDKARDCYDTALSRLATGKGNLAKMSRDLRELGIKTEKQMPRNVARLMEQDPSADETGRIEQQSE